MWEAILGILTSGNFLQIVLGIAVLVILFSVLVKKGLISFKGKGLKVGHSDQQRRRIGEHSLYGVHRGNL